MKRKEFIQTIAGTTAVIAGAGAAGLVTGSCAEKRPVIDYNNTSKAIKGLRFGVSVYSYGNDFATGATNLERCMAEIADIGAEGLEILGEAHIKGYPNPSKEWIDTWYKNLDKYKLVPTAYDIFCDTMFYPDKLLTPEELLEFLIVDMKVANSLGYKVFRQQVAPYPADDPSEEYLAPYVMSTRAMKFLELAIPHLEKYDIKIALELHSPTHLKSRWIDGCLELIQRTKTQHIGFCPDFSAFTSRPQKMQTNMLLAQGAKQEIIDYIISAYQQDLGPEKTMEEVKKMGGSPAEINFASAAGIYHASNNNPNDLSIVAQLIYHTHAKFYEVLDDFSGEYSMNYPAILKAYVDNGVTGWIDSECEGSRPDVTTSGHVRMHQTMMRKILASL
jgi:sugar phosphate isomerase/epimerase